MEEVTTIPMTESEKQALRWFQEVQDESFERGYFSGIEEALQTIEAVRKYEWELDGLSISDQVLFDRIIAAVRELNTSVVPNPQSEGGVLL